MAQAFARLRVSGSVLGLILFESEQLPYQPLWDMWAQLFRGSVDGDPQPTIGP